MKNCVDLRTNNFVELDQGPSERKSENLRSLAPTCESVWSDPKSVDELHAGIDLDYPEELVCISQSAVLQALLRRQTRLVLVSQLCHPYGKLSSPVFYFYPFTAEFLSQKLQENELLPVLTQTVPLE